MASALRERTEAVIAVELDRLGRRTCLGDREIDLVAETLRQITESLLLDRVRDAGFAAPLVAALFDLEGT